jgi:soluble lytic murein transglycosylase
MVQWQQCANAAQDLTDQDLTDQDLTDRDLTVIVRLSTRLLAGLLAAGVSTVALETQIAGGAPLADAQASTPTLPSSPTTGRGLKADKSKEVKSKDQKKHAAGTAGDVPIPRPRPGSSGAKAAVRSTAVTPGAATVGAATAGPAAPDAAVVAQPPVMPPVRLAVAPTDETAPADIAVIKEAVVDARKGRTDQASDLQKTIADPLGRKLVEWAILRKDDAEGIELGRYTAFISQNPNWPAIGLVRRRAEAVLWTERPDPAFVRSFFGNDRPASAKGKFALARALLLQGDRARARACPSSESISDANRVEPICAAQNLVRDAWRNDAFAGDLESQALDVFGDLITPADHVARMNMRLYADDAEGGLRAANRVGGTALAIAKARIAVIQKAANAKALLDAVPAEARHDVGYIFSRVQLLRRADKADKDAEAAALILSIPPEQDQAIDADHWWVERRLIARRLLDVGQFKTAYRIARDAPIPSKENYRAERQFTAGWIALRFLNDPATALAHFAKVAQGNSNPIALARAGYWQGRAADALGRSNEAHAHYEAAARYSTAYYGQIARARLGHQDLVLRPPPAPAREALEVARAIDLLYAIDERDLIAGALADLGERADDPVALAAIADIAARHLDARATAQLGKAALARGLPLEHYAFPTAGLPEYHAIGPAIEPAVAYAIARQESTFNPKTVSSARAMGLMQVTPAAARYVAGKFHAPFDEKRLLSDQAYNMQLGAAELGDLLADYRGSYILTFAGYNAGRGRVKEWIAKYGDPRNPKVDPIDWVERIPFSETRNYVQRVLENLQVYRVRFGGGSKLLIEADLHRGEH